MLRRFGFAGPMLVFVPVAQCRNVIHLYYGYRMPPFGYQPTPTPVARFPGGARI
jgi:hypothetical protein